jgi:hypothetical protein
LSEIVVKFYIEFEDGRYYAESRGGFEIDDEEEDEEDDEEDDQESI